MFKRLTLGFLFLILLIISASCSSPKESTTQIEEDMVSDVSSSDSEVKQVVPEEGVPEMPATPQSIKFKSADGVELQGTYYPSAQKDASLVILMHWAQSDQKDWVEIAYWLQDRGLGGTTDNPSNLPWLDSSWFPLMIKEKSFAVFTFTFRGCDGGCKSFDRDKWLIDAQSAVEYARELPGIDPMKIAIIGASIGADGAADGCLHMNSLYAGSCRGAFSQSPGNYLILRYPEVVDDLGSLSPPVPAWCLYSEADPESSIVCDGISADNYKPIVYYADAIDGFPHGMMLIQPDVEPNPLDLMLEFLEEVLD